MRAPAELGGLGPRAHHPYALAVLVPEECEGPIASASAPRGLDDLHVRIGENLRVRCGADLGQLLGTHRRRVGEVESQVVGCDEGTLLAHVVPQHPSQSGMQEVRSRVVAPDRLAPVHVYGRERFLSREQLTLDGGPMHDQTGQHALCIGHLGSARLGGYDAGVAHLTSGLCVEGGAVEHHLDGSRIRPLLDGEHGGRFVEMAVTGELRGPSWSSSPR